MRAALTALGVTVAVVSTAWLWLAQPGQPIATAPATQGAGQQFPCLSYAPFRGDQNPLVDDIVSPEQIRADLAQLAKVTGCIRTYSTDHGLDQIPALARQAGLKVIQGIWLSRDKAVSRRQVERGIALAKEAPDVITALIVGNEVLLRGDMLAPDLAATIRAVKAQVPIPVTYADVWEFWLKHREIAEVVDFITIHILPYWEDFPIDAARAVLHVDQIRRRMAQAIPGKELMIGETGWPSAGRMREGAEPSRINQARFIADVLALAERDRLRLNIIEAYDQPWKRRLEGTVGGHWGVFDSASRAAKYPPGVAVINHPYWRWQWGAGVGYGAALILLAWVALRRKPWTPSWTAWAGVILTAISGGTLIGLAIEKWLLESYDFAGWLRWGALLLGAVLAAGGAVIGLVTGRGVPTLQELIGPKTMRATDTLSRMIGLALVLVCVVAAGVALGLVFDPRYQDFPYASLTMAVVPLALLAALDRPRLGQRPMAETVFAGLFAIATIYIAFNEGFSNWQSLWTGGALVLLAFTLWQARGAPAPE